MGWFVGFGLGFFSYFFYFLIPWLSYKKSKQTELKIHSEGCERVSLLSFTKEVTGKRNQTPVNFCFLVCFLCDGKTLLRSVALKSFSGIQVYLENPNAILATKDCSCADLVKERGGDGRSDVNLKSSNCGVFPTRIFFFYTGTLLRNKNCTANVNL